MVSCSYNRHSTTGVVERVTRAAISKAQGGKYSEGFWSGFASSALGGTIGKFKSLGGQMAMAAIVGGTASRLGGGKFANGAVSGAFVHMYNHMAHQMPNKRIHEAREGPLSIKAGGTGAVHLGLIGYHGHKGLTGDMTHCIRIGLGFLFSVGAEAIGTYQYSDVSSQGSWGIGAEVSVPGFGHAVSLAANPSVVEASYAYKGLGFGASVGIDICGL